MNQQTTIAPEEVQRIQADTIRRVIQLLTERAHDPAKIGRRVLVWKCSLRLPDADGRMLRNADLARRLNVSEARASAAVSTAQSQIFDLKTLRGGEPVATSSDPVGQ